MQGNLMAKGGKQGEIYVTLLEVMRYDLLDYIKCSFFAIPSFL